MATNRQFKMAESALERALDAAGGVAALSVRLGISRQALHRWRVVPIDRVLEVERLTGVPRYELRPDFYQTA